MATTMLRPREAMSRAGRESTHAFRSPGFSMCAFVLVSSLGIALGWLVVPARMGTLGLSAFPTGVASACVALACLLVRVGARDQVLPALANVLNAAAALLAAGSLTGWWQLHAVVTVVDAPAMSSASGTALLAASLAAMLLVTGSGRRAILALRELLAVIVVAVPVLSLVGRLLGVADHAGRMALSTSILLLVLGSALIASSPAGPIARTLRDDSVGGQMARRLVSAALLVPTAYGFARIRAEKAGIIELERAVQLMVFATMLTLVAVVLWLAHRLTTSERKVRSLVEEHELFVGVASHEMRTPLAVIRNFADTMVAEWDAIPDDERRRYTEIIGGQARRMLRMVADLVTVARITAGEAADGGQEVDLAEVVEEALREIDADDVSLVVEHRPRVEADPDQVRQMLVNYVANARVHGALPIVVTVDVRSGHAVTSVEDAGSLIPAEDAERLFRRFSRLGATGGGSGLGLWIVQGLAEAHGGRAWYELHNGSGRFCFSLPVARPGTSVDAAGARAQALRAPGKAGADT